MKYYSYVLSLVITVLVSVSCSKKLDNNESTNNLNGKWQFIYAIGGELGSGIIKPSADSLETVSFNTDSTYGFYTNNELRAHGTYHLTGQNNSVISFTQITDAGMTLESEKLIWFAMDSLRIQDEYIPGFTANYARIK